MSGEAAGEAEGARIVLSRALAVAEPLVAALRAHPASERVELAGSARRMTDSVKDIDIIATAHAPLELARAAAELELVRVRLDARGGRGQAGDAHRREGRRADRRA